MVVPTPSAESSTQFATCSSGSHSGPTSGSPSPGALASSPSRTLSPWPPTTARSSKDVSPYTNQSSMPLRDGRICKTAGWITIPVRRNRPGSDGVDGGPRAAACGRAVVRQIRGRRDGRRPASDPPSPRTCPTATRRCGRTSASAPVSASRLNAGPDLNPCSRATTCSLPAIDVEAEKLFERAVASNTPLSHTDVINPAHDSCSATFPSGLVTPQ
jgi:hypothetical protein